MDDAIEAVEFLARSSTRVRLLAALDERGRLQKEELKGAVDASRTTIQRNLDALEERGWIRNDAREYRITELGAAIVDGFLELAKTVHVARRLEPLLARLPADSLDLPVRSLEDANVTVADPNNPLAPINRHVELVRSADRFRCLLPAVGLRPLLVVQESVLQGGHRHEVIVDEGVADTLRSDPAYRDPLAEMLASDRFALLVTDAEIPFYLGIGDGTVQLGVGDEDGTPKSLAECDSTVVREWAERTYAGYRADA